VEPAAHSELTETPFVNQRDPSRRMGSNGLPAVSRRAPLWADVPDEKWNDWRWQLSNRVNTLEEVEAVLNLTDEERDGF
jgi:lysine 2,3-aminomutase